MFNPQTYLGAAWAAVLAYFSFLSIDRAFQVLIMLGCVPLYVNDMRRLQDMLAVIAPHQHLPSFRKFVREYIAASDFMVVICGCVLIAATIQWFAESQQAYPVCEWSFAQAFLAISVTYALAGLGLIILYTRGLWFAAASQKRVKKWTEHASQSLANKYINVSIALATPEAWTKGGAIFLVASQIALRLQTSYVQEPGESEGSKFLRHITLAIGGLIVLHSLSMACVFCRITNLRGEERRNAEILNESR